MRRQPLPLTERVRLWDRALRELVALTNAQSQRATPAPEEDRPATRTRDDAS